MKLICVSLRRTTLPHLNLFVGSGFQGGFNFYDIQPGITCIGDIAAGCVDLEDDLLPQQPFGRDTWLSHNDSEISHETHERHENQRRNGVTTPGKGYQCRVNKSGVWFLS